MVTNITYMPFATLIPYLKSVGPYLTSVGLVTCFCFYIAVVKFSPLSKWIECIIF